MGPAGIAALLAALALLAPTASENALPTPEEAQQQWLNRLEGLHFTATLVRVEGGGTQRLTIRRDEAEGRERVLLRFEKPRSLAGQSWLLREQPGAEDELHFYSTRERDRPARRIPSLKARDPLRGADPILLGLRAGRWRTLAESVEAVERDGERALLLTERCEDPDAPFEQRRVWLDRETGVAMRLEQEREGRILLTGEVLELREVHGVKTPVLLRFERPDEEPVVYRVETVDYRRPIRASYFELPDT